MRDCGEISDNNIENLFYSFSCHGFDNERAHDSGKHFRYTPAGSDWIAHVMQAVEESDHVIPVVWDILRICHLEVNSIRNTCGFCSLACVVDGSLMVVVGPELRVRIGASHDYC